MGLWGVSSSIGNLGTGGGGGRIRRALAVARSRSDWTLWMSRLRARRRSSNAAPVSNPCSNSILRLSGWWSFAVVAAEAPGGGPSAATRRTVERRSGPDSSRDSGVVGV